MRKILCLSLSAVVTSLLLAGCAAPAPVPLGGAGSTGTILGGSRGIASVRPPVPVSRHTGTHTEVSVFYGTDRAREGAGYGGGRSRLPGVLDYGIVEVSIPAHHQEGQLEAPSIWRLEFSPDRARHVVMGTPRRCSRAEFLASLDATAGRTDGRQALVFVHGYNVSFEDATRRTAQLSHDLRFQGVPVCFSWPSKASTAQYTVDENNVEWSTPHLEQFLAELTGPGGVKKIHLIAHSMGNRALTRALERLVRAGGQDVISRVECIVLAAPDIDADVFRTQIAPVLASTGKPVTLYASANDKALQASRQVHEHPRAGDAGEGLIIHPGIETVDASKVDTSMLGHSYYGDSKKVLSDLFEAIVYKLPARRRNFLQPVVRGALEYFEFKTASP